MRHTVCANTRRAAMDPFYRCRRTFPVDEIDQTKLSRELGSDHFFPLIISPFDQNIGGDVSDQIMGRLFAENHHIIDRFERRYQDDLDGEFSLTTRKSDGVTVARVSIPLG